jgi:hypothetical protein
MAKSTSRPPKKPTPIDASTPFDEPATDMSAAEASPEEQSAAEPAPDPPQTVPQRKRNTPTFIETMNKVPKGDWGPRANIYLYRVEPVIDRTRSGDTKYINCYAEPINEDRIMGDYGSGRYKLILNFRKPGAATGDIIDSDYWDIMNMKYPPKIPLGEWTDDPRNKKWAWAKEANGIPATPAAPSPTDPLAAFGTFMDIQDRVEERLKPQQPAAAATTVDPWAAAEKILNMRSDNPMVEILKQQQADAAKALESERERNFKAAESAREREFKLQERLLEAKTAAPQSKSFMEQALDLANDPAKLEPLKKLASAFGFGGTESAGRVGRTTGMDILNNLVSGPAGEVLARGAAQLLITLPSILQPNPANTNGQQAAHPPDQVAPPANQQPAQETPEQRIYRIGMTITRPMIAEWFMKNATGQQFAAWMNDSWPDDYQFIKLLGAENLIQRYRNSPVWAAVSFKEKEFIAFIQEFCEWTEPKDEDQPINAEGVEDLEDKEAVQ